MCARVRVRACACDVNDSASISREYIPYASMVRVWFLVFLRMPVVMIMAPVLTKIPRAFSLHRSVPWPAVLVIYIWGYAMSRSGARGAWHNADIPQAQARWPWSRSPGPVGISAALGHCGAGRCCRNRSRAALQLDGTGEFRFADGAGGPERSGLRTSALASDCGG